MQPFQRLFARAPQAQPAVASPQPYPEPRRYASRRELLTMAVRDTLRRHGIPAEWIHAEANPVLTRRSVRAIQLRLVARHWDPALITCVVALQKSIAARLARLDPASAEWLAGISWKFEPEDESLCPTLPSADFWQDDSRPAPARVSVRGDDAEWKQRLAEGDRAFAGQGRNAFGPTEPMPI